MRKSPTTLLLPLLLVAEAARGEARLEPIQVAGDRPTDAAAEDAPAFVTVVDARRPSARVVSVAELLEGEAGVRVRSRGGLGSFSSVSIRGADAGEVAVFLDGVPLGRTASAGVDLSQIPADGLERIEIFRGVPPPELGAEAIGGAIHLFSRRSRRPPSWRLSSGVGSFGARSLALGHGGSDGKLRFDASLAYHGGSGDFTYYDPQGTLLDRGDDRTSRRRNNGFDQLSADVTVGRELGGGLRVDLGSHAFLKRQGVPGIAGAETETASLATGRLLVDAGINLLRRRWDGQARAHFLYQRSLFDNSGDDRAGNYGPSRIDGETLAGGLDLKAGAPLGRHQVLTLLADGRAEGHRPRDLLAPERTRPSSLRLRGGLALVDEVRLWRDRIALSPALRVDGVSNSLAAGQGVEATQGQGDASSDAFFSPRLGARLRATPWLTIKGNVGRFVRLPTVVELFGDGAFILPRPSLRPETAVGGDLGVAVTLDTARVGLAAEATFFGRRLVDAIAYLPSARGLAASNIGEARVLGGELRVRLRLGSLARLTLAYTLLDPVNLTDEPGARGKQLPGRARHEVTARADATLGPLAVFYEVGFLDRVFRDPQNYSPLPSHVLHSAGLSLTLPPRLRLPLALTVEVRNLLDLRVTDLPLGGSIHAGATVPYPLVDTFDYPLPGRAVYATLALRTP